MNKLRLAVVGLGRVANCHLDAISKLPDDVVLEAIVDLNEERLSATKAAFGPTKAYASVDQALEDEEIDGYIVCLPHFLHHPIARRLLSAGKHVLMEKPLALNLLQSLDLVQLAEEKEVVLMGAQSRRYYDAIELAHGNLKRIGNPIHISYVWGDHFSSDWSPPWWESAQRTGGLVVPLCGSHAIDYVLWTLDEMPVQVFSKHVSNPDTIWEGEDQVSCLLSFADGSTASIVLSATADPEVHEVVHFGPYGSIKYAGGDEHKQQILGFCSMDLWVKGEQLLSGIQDETNFVRQMRQFVVAIRGTGDSMATGVELLRLASVLDAMQESAQQGVAVKPKSVGEGARSRRGLRKSGVSHFPASKS